MRTKLSATELAALEVRIRQLMNGVKHEEHTNTAGFLGPGPHRYFAISTPSYCEAFGMIQALQVMGFGQMGGAGPKAPKGANVFDLRRWFDDIMEKILKERP